MLARRWMLPLGTTCTTPARSRRMIVRSVMRSTSPPVPSMFATSPTRTWFSRMMKNPLMMSFTSVCAPKPTASPTMPAPVRIGVMSTANSRSTISVAMSDTSTNTVFCSRLPIVRARFARSMTSTDDPSPTVASRRVVTSPTTWTTSHASRRMRPTRRPDCAAQRPSASGLKPTAVWTPARCSAGKMKMPAASRKTTRRTRRTPPRAFSPGGGGSVPAGAAPAAAVAGVLPPARTMRPRSAREATSATRYAAASATTTAMAYTVQGGKPSR